MNAMTKKRALAAIVTVFLSVSAAAAQKTEITISLNEQFFDALLDAIYQNSPPPEFQLSSKSGPPAVAGGLTEVSSFSHAGSTLSAPQSNISNEIVIASGFRLKPAATGFGDQLTTYSSPLTVPACGSVTLLRENKSMRTAVHFRDGKIYAPVAFTGTQSMPFVGCVDFGGYAETNIDLQFDHDAQKLIGRVKVVNVNINGTAGIGGSLIARMVQSSIDKKLNPIEIISLDKLSFPFTLQNSAKLKLKATGVRTDIAGSALNIVISYEFVKD
jgi:hypothetical protein